MAKQMNTLSPAQKSVKKKRQKEYLTIFVNGEQKRVKRPVTIDGMDVDEFIRKNADPIWIEQSEIWEYMDSTEDDGLLSFDEKDEKEGLALSKECEYENARKSKGRTANACFKPASGEREV